MPVAESCKDETVLGYVGRDSVLKLRTEFLIADGAGEELAPRGLPTPLAYVSF